MDLRDLLGPDREWMSDGACIGSDPELWFPTQRMRLEEFLLARRICSNCCVRLQCLAYALSHGIEHGIWGGSTPNDRKKMKRAAG